MLARRTEEEFATSPAGECPEIELCTSRLDEAYQGVLRRRVKNPQTETAAGLQVIIFEAITHSIVRTVLFDEHGLSARIFVQFVI